MWPSDNQWEQHTKFFFKVSEQSFAGGQRQLAWRRMFQIRQTNMTAKKQRYAEDEFSKSTH